MPAHDLQDPRICMGEYVTEASNCIDAAASPDSIRVLSSWHARSVQEATYARNQLGFSIEQIQRYVNYDELTWILNIFILCQLIRYNGGLL